MSTDQNTNKFGHKAIWTQYFMLWQAFNNGDSAYLSEKLGKDIDLKTQFTGDYVYKMIRYYFTGDRELSPITLSAQLDITHKTEYQSNTWESTSSDSAKAKSRKKLSDSALESYVNLVNDANPDSHDDMTFLAFVSALLVKSGQFTWERVKRETTQWEVIEHNGKSGRFETGNLLDDSQAESGESYFNFAKNLVVFNPELA